MARKQGQGQFENRPDAPTDLFTGILQEQFVRFLDQHVFEDFGSSSSDSKGRSAGFVICDRASAALNS
ncbi:MAG: hypothetical protein J4O05_06935 [Chloroflexi bacterium]|nr:hypothetical protein [Chloroflexota bacterium]MCI0837136.1 hypothetical protein [Chloroflexota bacterium]MCI0881827.1 hypothetical protein [Chloroflexota bacterium]